MSYQRKEQQHQQQQREIFVELQDEPFKGTSDLDSLSIQDHFPGAITNGSVGSNERIGGMVPTGSTSTSESIYGASGSRAGRDRSLSAGSVRRFHERRIKIALEEHQKLLTQQSQGFEKLEAYVLSNDENVMPFDTRHPTISKSSNDDDEVSLNLSRPTGTGSQQLRLWIREVNMAVSTKRNQSPPLVIETENLEKCIAGIPPRTALSPANRNAMDTFSPTHMEDIHRLRDTNRKEPTFSNPTKKKEKRGVISAKTQWQEKYGKEKSLRTHSPAVSSGRPMHTSSSTRASTFIHSDSPVRSSTASDNSAVLASIEGKYRSLREDLTRDPSTLEDQTSYSDNDGADETEGARDDYKRDALDRLCCERTRSRPNRFHSRVSRAKTPPRGPRVEFARDQFTLGMLSTRSSGILTAHSWSSGSSVHSTFSGSTIPPPKGCGALFICD